jgi:uncharacterized membrane protein YgaE (UPF0421/DUF939 family)
MGALAGIAGSWLLGKARDYFAYILLGVAILGVVLTILFKAKSLGRAEEQVKNMERTIEIIKRRKEIERENAEEIRDSGKSASDILRERWSRD